MVLAVNPITSDWAEIARNNPKCLSVKPDGKIKFAFIFSNWYSGATLLAILLNNHQKLTCNGETFPFKAKDLNIYRCSCGNNLLTCEYYRQAAAHLLHDKRNPEKSQLFTVLPQLSKVEIVDKWLSSFNYFPNLRNICMQALPFYKRKVKYFLREHYIFYTYGCRFEETAIYIDGTKSLRRAELFAKYFSESFRVLHLVRDGRGFCNSFLKNRKLSKGKLPEAAKAWHEYIKLVDLFKKRYQRVPILTVRYEDLCQNIESEITRILAFLEVDFDSEMLTGFNRTFHILGNVMRKNFDGCVKEDLSWKTEFSNLENDELSRLMREGLRRYDYI